MKNYRKIALKCGVIDWSTDTWGHIASYKVNRENNYVEITHMSGWQKKEEIKEDTIQKIDEKQRSQLDEMCDKLIPKIDSYIKRYRGLFLLHGTNVLLQYSMQHWVVGSCWLVGTAVYFAQFYFPYKLQKEMKLVSWIINNKESVDKVIKREVEEKMPKRDDLNTINLVRSEYPINLVPYPENMYEDGINLSNIDELNIKQLKKLKKKAKKTGD